MWNIDQGTAIFSDDLVYSVKKTPENDFVEPITWDGNKKLLLHKTSTPEGLYKTESKVIEKYTMNSIYGRDITAVRNLTADGKASDYDLFLNCSDGVVKKKIKAQYQTIDTGKHKVDNSLINVCKSTVQEGRFVPDFQKSTIPVGVYNDILILQIEVSGETNLEYLMCAVHYGEFKGAIHIKRDEVWEVINSEKKVVSVIDNKKKKLYKEFDIDFVAFPILNKVM